MPEEGALFADRETLLTFEEITRLVRLLVQRFGFRDVRLTGGEPLVRKEVTRLVEMLAAIPGLEDLSLTTNGVLLERFAEPLKDAGLRRLNISLDTVHEATYQRVSRRQGVSKVIRGIDAAISQGFEQIKLNTTALRGVTEAEVVSLIQFANERDVQIRFIEFMPLDTDRAWNRSRMLDGQTLRVIIEREFGPLRRVRPPNPSQPATDYVLPGNQRVGIIESVSNAFCGNCDRIRLTSDGAIRNCLFSHDETPIRHLLRSGADDDLILQQFEDSVNAKSAGHGINRAESFAPPERPMYSIGG